MTATTVATQPAARVPPATRARTTGSWRVATCAPGSPAPLGPHVAGHAARRRAGVRHDGDYDSRAHRARDAGTTLRERVRQREPRGNRQPGDTGRRLAGRNADRA